MAAAALKGIASLSRSQARRIVTIDMWWAVILNPYSRDEESLTYVADLEEIIRCATIDILWCVRPSIRFCLSSCDVRSKGEAFPSKRFRLTKFNVVQPKTPIISFFVREMLRPYKSGRITLEPDAVKGNRLSSRDRAIGIISRHSFRNEAIPNIIHGRCCFERDCFALPLAGSRDRSQ